MRAAEHQGVDLAVDERCEVAASHVDDVLPARDAGLDELDEPWARHAGDLQVRRSGEGVDVGARLVGAPGRDDSDPVVAGGSSRPTHRGSDDLDHGHVVPLARIVQDGGAGGVARDDEGLHAVVDEAVEALEGELAGLRDGPRPVGRPGRVPEVGDRLVRELVEHGACDGQPAVARVEDPDGCIRHGVKARCRPPR